MNQVLEFLKGLKFKFEKVALPKFTSMDSKLYVDLSFRVSLDAPGDHEALVASVLNSMTALGNSSQSSSSSSN